MAVETRLYDLLELSPDASASDIKKAFRRLALKHHPDRGGDTKQFQELSMAHEVLADSEKRQIYDSYGEEGLRQASQGGDPGASMFSRARSADIGEVFGGLFSEFSGLFGSKPTGRRKPRKPEDVNFEISVSLKDLYLGTRKPIAITRTTSCKRCSGSGSSKPDAEVSCQECNGLGVHEVMRRIGPGMVQRFRTVCQACGGQGRVLPFEFVCKACGGGKTAQETKTLEVHIPAGTSDGQHFVMSGEGDALPGQIAGDVIFRVRTQSHDTFIRNGHDLIMHAQITLVESLCGCKLEVKHLDGRVLHVTSKPGVVLKPGSLHRVVDEGMPVPNMTGLHGALLIKLDVEFPDKLPHDLPRQLSDSMHQVGQPPEVEKGQPQWFVVLWNTVRRWMAIQNDAEHAKVPQHSDVMTDYIIMEPVDDFHRSRL